eukprot:gnl/TRDRNA2_/TRDRNA2_146407_c2_seq1.p1 gnl/TRDRNA2_/TRDRNA2_146407_c2~~gnl/TRDRNA2_/TRDRNA2_146407_c2_seq1.p1  ORF type:complete len:280 (+),score=31.01 gnl/TRDRNA2_/TRDRNA2_146407_c2_seq1:1-840(+)
MVHALSSGDILKKDVGSLSLLSWLCEALVPDAIDKNLMLKEEVLIAFVETTMLCLFMVFVSVASLRGLCSSSPSERWDAVAAIFWNYCGKLQTFSALKLLYFVTPQVLIPQVGIAVQHAVERHWSYLGLPLVCWMFSRVLCFVIGFDAFVVKIRRVNDDSSLVSYAALMNQLLGIVQLNWFVRDRLHRFIFGGEDGYVSDREMQVLKVWQAMLVRRIWQTHSFLRFVAIMVTFSDSDFQMLVLQEVEVHADEEAPSEELPSSVLRPSELELRSLRHCSF